MSTSFEPRVLHDSTDVPHLDERTWQSLWGIFVAICRHWNNLPEHEAYRSDFVIFVKNRMRVDASYAVEYARAARFMERLIAERGSDAAYALLLTDPGASVKPPTTDLARTRQGVANEFVMLQLSLGGFRALGGAVNYPGFVCGTNAVGRTPYRTYPG